MQYNAKDALNSDSCPPDTRLKAMSFRRLSEAKTEGPYEIYEPSMT